MAEADYITIGWNLARTAAILLAGYLIASACAKTANRLLQKRLNTHRAMVIQRIIYYAVLILFGVSALNQLGLQLGVVLGAAGIFTVAIGFASQTSMSNLISGLFLIWENPFSLGDSIKIGEVTGEVVSIDLLSVKLRTPDNLYVRIPNEQLIKANITTLTRFPIRRADLKLMVGYDQDLDQVKQRLLEIADAEPLCLIDPKPVFSVLGFAESAIELQLSVWGIRENFLDLRNSMYSKIRTDFLSEGIEPPYPQRRVIVEEKRASTHAAGTEAEG